MDDDTYSLAIKNTLDEIQNACPDIKHSFMFREHGELIAGSENTPKKTIVQAVDALDSILEKTESIGGFEGIVLEGNEGTASVSRMNDLYLVTITSKNADESYVNTITHVLISTVLKLLEKLTPAPLKNNPPPQETDPNISIEQEPERTEESLLEPIEEEHEPPSESNDQPEPVITNPPANQFIVEEATGLFRAADTVYVEDAAITRWTQLCAGKKITQVEIETFAGKSTKCKIKAIKNPKHKGKSIIQMPEKMQATLEIEKGELVRVRPIVE